jgi:hypothetical protein
VLRRVLTESRDRTSARHFPGPTRGRVSLRS